MNFGDQAWAVIVDVIVSPTGGRRSRAWSRHLAGALPRGHPSCVLELSEIAPETPRLLTRAEYERLIETGLFEDERVELLEGVLIRMSPHRPEHDSAIEYLTELLVRQLAQRARVRVRSGYAASDSSQPEPDLAVVPTGNYGAAHPSEALLIIEVAKSSLAKDRGFRRDSTLSRASRSTGS